MYDSFGNILTETNATNGNRFKFAGMEYDSTTKEYYDRARDYDSTIGRFVSLDPKGFAAKDHNLYRNVENDPTNGTDPTGLLGITVDKVVVYDAQIGLLVYGVATPDEDWELGGVDITLQLPGGGSFQQAATARVRSRWFYR